MTSYFHVDHKAFVFMMMCFAPKERSSAPSELEYTHPSHQALPGLANIEGSFGANC